LNQVATTHFDHVHVLSVVLEGEKTWQMLPNQAIDADLIDSAEPNQAPACVPGSHALGASDNWSQVVLGPGQALFVPALMWHRVVSGPQGSVSINLLREPDNVK
jgi:ribosomal protein L16 Arg81 hydroxylase